MSKYIVIGLFLFSLMSCSRPNAVPVSQAGYIQEAKFRNNQETITQSLFNPKESTISEEDIQRLLNGKIKVPDSVRVAVLNLNATFNHYNNYYAWNNEEEMKLQRTNFELLKNAMMTTERAHKVFLLPNMVIQKNPSLQQLREAAVRMQADMLLIFNLRSDLYYKYKMFKKNEVKAFASCEALLMDIRTGVIPFSNVMTEDVMIKKDDSDFNNEETRRRAIADATKKTLQGLGNDLVNYFNNEL